MRTSVLITALLGAVAVGGLAEAQTAKMPKTGDITRTDFIARAEAQFARLDVDRNGVLSVGERIAGRDRARIGAMRAQDDAMPAPGAGRPRGQGRGQGRGMGGGFAGFDTDGDGKVTRAEYDARSKTQFERMDANRDGTVDATERAAMPGGGRMGRRTDADGNGSLSRAEFDAGAKTRFDRMDVNGDSVLDAAEMQPRRPAPTGTPTPMPTPTSPSGA